VQRCALPIYSSHKTGTWSWSGTGDEDSPYTVTITATNADHTTSTTTFDVSFTDVAPTVTGTSSVSGVEGTTVSNSGSYADFDDPVSVSGTGVVDNGNGTWSWSGTAPDEDSAGYDVTVTATNDDGSTGSFTFHVSGTDAAPTVTGGS